MAYDDTEFIDRGFPPAPVPAAAPRTSSPVRSGRAPSREELDARVSETQQQLAKLMESQQRLERARAELEAMRQRRAEFQVGRTEMREQLNRGISLLERCELAARRDAEQMSKSLGALRESLANVEAIHDESWSEDNWGLELGRALTVIENSRVEWNTARIKWPVLDGKVPAPDEPSQKPPLDFASLSFGALCRIGIAFTWPLLVIGAGILATLLVSHFR